MSKKIQINNYYSQWIEKIICALSEVQICKISKWIAKYEQKLAFDGVDPIDLSNIYMIIILS